MLGPEDPVYDPLPSATSVRVLYLAPGKPDDEVFCFLFPCDLDKDHARDTTVPRPFENLCIAQAQSSAADHPLQFLLPLDSYIDESAEDDETSRTASARLGAPSRAEPRQDQRGETQDVAGDGGSRDDFTSIGGTPANVAEKNGMPREQAASTDDPSYDSVSRPHEEPSDDVWDLMQLMRLHQAGGALNDHVHRHPFQRFSALSYVWGSIDNPAYIIMNGNTKFWITQNLFRALKSLRRPDVAQSLWVDAICMNQQDAEEKKLQIALMRRVYQQAEKVIAFVPQTPDDTQSLNDLVVKILNAGRKCQELIDSGVIMDQNELLESTEAANAESPGEAPSSPSKREINIKQLPLKPTGTCIEDYDLPPEDDPAWIAWRKFFASPYFRRIWILQEYAMARSVDYRFGDGQAPSSLMLLAMYYVRYMSRLLNAHYLGRGENSELTRAALLGWKGLEGMTIERVSIQDGDEAEKLIHKIHSAMSFDATDPRDKIYALLGLVSDAGAFMDLVTYEQDQTYAKVYRSFARAFIENGHCVNILRMACLMPWNPELPTWIPDWSASTASMTSAISSDHRFRAGGESELHATINQDQLILAGTTFDTIEFVADAFVPFSGNSPLSAGALRLQDFFETFAISTGQVCNHVNPQDSAPTMAQMLSAISMQPKPFLLSQPDHEPGTGTGTDTGALKDLALCQMLLVRLMHYLEIEDHANHKVVFTAFPEKDRDFIQLVAENTVSRRFCVTKAGKRVGLVPERAQVGDHVAVVFGMPVPLVLRKVVGRDGGGEPAEAEEEHEQQQQQAEYRLVGDAYVTGVMQGEMLVEGNVTNTGQRMVLV
ncbi:uncharacterized protein PV07_09860 [Cladophialophora immunda]|uniref:Heterokaryon incompatibility domain-containing protein n=1 Tax=Cladophialophora immunda TaxID=569365 RepID=A0A0D2BYD9_9EURO|nr:uncharacterized protein PV07_09860 [Cladophialophora immunda]KIW24128.1 hypothetical protein PV07_09860 [Cladophialophora immunda]